MLEERRKCTNFWISSNTQVKKILALLLLPVLIAGLGKIYRRSHTLTVIRKNTTQNIALNIKKISQKTIISLSNF